MLLNLRAWHKENKKMYNVTMIDYERELIHVDDKSEGFFDAFDVIAMYSTGHFDTKGNEAFEGDILYYPDQDEDQYGIIKFNHNRLAFVLDNGYEQLIFGDDWGIGEIVGNIYENKDLTNMVQ